MTWPFPAPHDDGKARHLLRGTTMPNIALPTTEGRDVNFSHLDGWTILFIYPWTGQPGLANPPGWDDIPGAHGSTPEAEGFRNAYAEFQLLGYDVFGVSAQSAAEQREFATRAGIPYLLLSDSDFAFADALDLPSFETGGVRYLKRLTMVVRNGVIYRVIYPVYEPAGHAREILKSLSQARA